MFLDERGRRGLLIRALGVLGALASSGALALIVIGALAFVHISPLRVGGHGILSVHVAVRHRSAPRGVAADPIPHGRGEHSDRESKAKRASA